MDACVRHVIDIMKNVSQVQKIRIMDIVVVYDDRVDRRKVRGEMDGHDDRVDKNEEAEIRWRRRRGRWRRCSHAFNRVSTVVVRRVQKPRP